VQDERSIAPVADDVRGAAEAESRTLARMARSFAHWICRK
jgi:hypothetical protein